MTARGVRLRRGCATGWAHRQSGRGRRRRRAAATRYRQTSGGGLSAVAIEPFGGFGKFSFCAFRIDYANSALRSGVAAHVRLHKNRQKPLFFFFLWYILLWCDYFTAYEPLPIKQNIYFVQLIHTDTQCLQPKKYLILYTKRGKIITRSGIDGCCNNGVVMRAAY